ncbi:MAG: hypothetical protein RLZZ230_212 [Candidatus Parcubacteria bacterium]|jgi:hypothetical protein
MLFEKIQLDAEEVVLKTVRKHWFIIVTELFGVFSMFLFPFFILFIVAIFPNLLDSLNLNLAHYTALISFAIAGWSILTLMSGFMIWTHYYLDHWIITDRRIILVDQVAFFNRNVSMFRLERLQDIKFSIDGVIPTFLNFGSLKAETAGNSESNFSSTGLPDPRGLQAIIQKAMDDRISAIHMHPEELI